MAAQNISKEVVTKFVTTKLNVDLDVGDKHEVLSKIVSSFMQKIPFQNLTMMATSLDECEIPSSEECVRSVLEGYGGVCFALNSVMCSILKALDYDTSLLLCSVAVPAANDHAAVLVKSLKTKGDNWLVDVGFGNPCFKPVNMDFKRESETITQSYHTYKYLKRGDTYIRLHKVNKGGAFPTIENGWAHAYYFNLEPTEYQKISDSINQRIYKTDEGNFFHVSPRLISFDSNMKAIFFKDGYLLKEGEDGKLHQEEIEGDVAETVQNLCPAIPIKTIGAAMKTFQNVQK